MAQALRKVWLEPEEQFDAVAPQVTPRRRRQSMAAPSWQRLLINAAVVACVLGVVVMYINAHAHIAKLEMERQLLQREAARLARERTQLCLQLDRFSSQPRLAALAQAEGLQLPEAGQIDFVRVAEAPPAAVVAAVQPAQQSDAWFARSSRLLMASLDDAFARVSRGPGNVAYAQE